MSLHKSHNLQFERDQPNAKGTPMSYRTLIFDDEREIRSLLWTIFDRRGYEVFTFPHPGLCPINHVDDCPCPKEESCSDVIVTDLEMPNLNGMDFIREQLEKGCRCKNIALMSGNIADDLIATAQTLGLRFFKKPFSIIALTEWLDEIEKDISPQRKLTDWYLQGK